MAANLYKKSFHPAPRRAKLPPSGPATGSFTGFTGEQIFCSNMTRNPISAWVASLMVFTVLNLIGITGKFTAARSELAVR